MHCKTATFSLASASGRNRTATAETGALQALGLTFAQPMHGAIAGLDHTLPTPACNPTALLKVLTRQLALTATYLLGTRRTHGPKPCPSACNCDLTEQVLGTPTLETPILRYPFCSVG